MKITTELKKYIDALRSRSLLVSFDGDMNKTISNVTHDSREVTRGTLFICKGAGFKPEYLYSAVEKGAVAYISETDYRIPASAVIVSDVRAAMAAAAKVFFDDAPSKLRTVGITGTKGKSTTAYYMKAVLDEFNGGKTAILSSIDNFDGVVSEESHLTTPESLMLFNHCSNAVDSGLSHLVMEVSSQGLKLGRVCEMNYDVAAFLNIGADHISPIEHADFEDYFSSKLKIFDYCKAACVNLDCEHSDRILSEARKRNIGILTFGTDEKCDIYGFDIRANNGGINFSVRDGGSVLPYRINMTGLFNVSNALCVIAMSKILGIPYRYVSAGLAKATVPGRMEVFESRDGKCTVIVDYAHNKMSFRALYESTKIEYPDKKIITVFGCPGGKAFVRREDLGRLSGINSWLSILTEEDPGPEDPYDIAVDISQYVADEGGKYEITVNREQAIADAILKYGENSVILFTAKGRETRQKRGTAYIHVPSDVDYTVKYLAEYDALHK